MFAFSPWRNKTRMRVDRGTHRRTIRRRRLNEGERLESRYALAMVQAGFGWAGTIDPVQTIDGDHYVEIESTALDQDGNLYVAGIFSGQIDVDPSAGSAVLASNTFTINGETEYAWNTFVTKYSPTGAVLWAKRFESDGEGTQRHQLAVAPNGNVVIAGHLFTPFDADPGPGRTTLSHINPAASSIGGPPTDAFVISLSSNGQFNWATRYGRSGDEQNLVQALTVDASGGIYVAGGFSGTISLGASGPGTPILSSPDAVQHGYVLKLAANGSFQWAKAFESEASSDVRFLGQDGIGGIYVAGGFEGSVDINPGLPVSESFKDEPGLGSYLARLNAAGNFTGGAGFPGLNADGITGFHVDAVGNIYVSGFVSGTYPVADILGPSAGDVVFRTSSVEDYDAFVLKLLPTGQVAWAKQFGSSIGGDYADCITTDQFGNVIVGGSFTGTVDFDPGPGIQQVASSTVNDAFLLWLDRDGKFISVRGFAGSGEEETIESVHVDRQGNTFILGGFGSPIDMDPGEGVALLADSWAAYAEEIGMHHESRFFSKQATVSAIGQAIGGVQVGVGPAGYVIRNNDSLIPVSYGGRIASPTSPGGGWAIVGGRSAGSGYETLWRSASGGYGAWVLDANGALVSSRSLSLTDVLALETSLGTDLTGDGKSGMAFTAASSAVGGVVFGSTPRGYAVRVGNNAFIQVTFGGKDASASNPGAGWRAVGARASQGGGFDVLWAGPGNAFGAWQLDSSGRQQSAFALTATQVLQLEEQFGQDINGDAEIGLPFTPQGGAFGTVQFGSTPLGYALKQNNGSPIQVTFGGRNASASVPGSGWKAIGGRAAGGGYEILWSGPNSLFGAWTLDTQGRQTGTRPISQGELHALESEGQIDIDGDGSIGAVFSPNGQLLGNVQFGNVPSGYAIQVGSGQPIPISSGGRSASASSPGGGWKAFAARASAASRYEVFWRGPTEQVGSWIVDSSGKQVSAKLFTPSELAQLEQSLGIDLDGNGMIGQPPSDSWVPFPSNEVFGTTSAGYEFRTQGGSIKIPVMYVGGQASASNPGRGWVAVGGRFRNDVIPEVFWRGPAGAVGIWELLSSGRLQSTRSLARDEIVSLEVEERLDLNGDGSIGSPFIPLGPVIDAVQLGTTPLGYAIRRSNSQPLQVSYGAGLYASATTPGAGWVGDRAWADGSKYQMLWRNETTGLYGLWDIDENGRQTSVKLLSSSAVAKILDGSFDGVVGDATTVPVLPSAPKGLAASARDGAMSLTWSPVVTSGATVRGYVLEISEDSSFRTSTRYPVTAASLTVPNLSNGKTYFARVATWAEQGVGEFSASISATLSSAPLPLQPQSLNVSAGDRSLAVQWAPPANYAAATASLSYVVEYSTNSSFSSPTSIGVGSSLATTLTGLSNNTTYYLRVAARSAGGLGQFSSTATGMPRSMASPPSAPMSIGTEPRDSSVLVSWASPSSTGNATITSYSVKFEINGVSSVQTTTSTSHVVTGLNNGSAYRFSVAAMNSAGLGVYSNSVTETPRAAVTVPGAPPTPWTFYAATPTAADATVSWSRPSADGNSPIREYQIQVSTNSSFSQNLQTYSSSPDARSGGGSLHRLLSLEQTYHFRVRARNDVGWGAWSGALTHLYPRDPAIAAPNPVTGVQASSFSKNIQVSWQRPATGAKTDYFLVEQLRYHPTENRVVDARPVVFETGSPQLYADGFTKTFSQDDSYRYQFRITAVNIYGSSAAVVTPLVSLPRRCNPLAAALGACGTSMAPAGLTARSAGDGTIQLAWDRLQNAQRYEIEWYNNQTNQTESGTTSTDEPSTKVLRLVPGQSYNFRVRALYRNGSSSQWSGWSTATTVSMTQAVPVQGDSWYAGVWAVRHRAEGPWGDVEEGYVKVNVRKVSDDGFFTTVEVTVDAEPSQNRYPNRLFKFPDTYRGTAAFRHEIPNSLLRDGVFDVLVNRSDNYVSPTLERQDPSDGKWTPVFRTAYDAFNIRIVRNGRDRFGLWGNPTTLEFGKIANASS